MTNYGICRQRYKKYIFRGYLKMYMGADQGTDNIVRKGLEKLL